MAVDLHTATLKPPVPAGGFDAGAGDVISQIGWNMVRGGLKPYYYSAPHIVTTLTHRGSVYSRSGPSWVPMIMARTVVNSLPGVTDAATLNRQYNALVAQNISDASGGFYRDLAIGAGVFIGAGFLGAAALSSAAAPAGAGAGVGSGVITTAAVDTGSTLTTTALDAGGGGGFFSGLGGTLSEGAAGLSTAAKTYGDAMGLKAAFDGGHPPATQPVSPPITPQPSPAPGGLFSTQHILMAAAVAASFLL